MEAYQLNQNCWGVCGFVAAIQAAVLNQVQGVSLQGTSYDTLFPVIKQFCQKNKILEPELLKFSEVFGTEHKYNDLDEVIGKMHGDSSMEQPVGLAMTGMAMSTLCKDLGFKNYNFHGTTTTTNTLEFEYKNTIYGLGKISGGNYRYGLLHWVYVDSNGTIMTWGQKSENLSILTNEHYYKITHYLPALF